MGIKSNILKPLIAFGTMLILAYNCSSIKLYNEVRHETMDRTIMEFKDGSFEVDNKLVPYVKEFIEEAEKNGRDMSEFSITYLGIYYDILPYGYYGVTYNQQPEGLNYSIINSMLKEFPNKTRTLVFHEMSHALGYTGHCHDKCDQIMSAKLNESNFYNDWKKQKKILFNNKKHDSI